MQTLWFGKHTLINESAPKMRCHHASSTLSSRGIGSHPTRMDCNCTRAYSHINTHDPTPSIHKQNPNGPHTNTGSCVCVCTRSMLLCCFGCVLSVGINLNDFTLNYTVRVCCASVRTHTVMHARHHLSVIIIYTIKKRRRPLVTVFVPHIFCRRPIDERTLGACVARLFDPFG